MTNPHDTIIFSLGSNVGARERMVSSAFELLRTDAVLDLRDARLSGLMHSPALLPENAPPEWDIPYVNAVVVAQCHLNDLRLILSRTQAIESTLGKTKRGHWAPREIDIDLIAYGNRHYHDDTLTLPHPHAASREFVLQPLAEFYPNWDWTCKE